MKSPTCAEIGAACRVSAATVSRALNNHPGIPKATRERVLVAAKQLGWRPNPLASAFMAHLRSTRPSSFKALLGVLVDFPTQKGMEELPSHVAQSYAGFKKRAAAYGYGTKVFSLADPDVTPVSLGRTMAEWNIPGFVITSMSQPGKVLHGIKWSKYALVAIGYSMEAPSVHRVVRNVPMGVKMAIERAFAMGYQRIGVAVSEEYDLRTNHGVMFPVSYMKTQLKPGQSIDSFLYRGESDPKSMDAIAQWLARTKPELVMGMFGPDVFDRLGWSVPKDISKVTFDRSPGYPGHAGLELRYEALGALAADVLISEIVLNRRGIPPNPVEYTVACEWVNGSSAPSKLKKSS